MKLNVPTLGVTLLLAALTVTGGEPTPLISKHGKLLLSEEFSAASIPANWQPGGRTNSFSIVDGALQGICDPADSHGPWCGVPIEGRNLTIQFSIKLPKPGAFLLLVDGTSQFGGEAHLLRLAIHGGGVALQQDRGSLDSKREQAGAKAKAKAEGRTVPPPTPEQLADPKFYRTELLTKEPAKLLDGQWHRVLIETRANDVVAQVDGQITLRGKATVVDAKKTRLVFLAGQSGTILVDDVKVWENDPLKEESR